MQPSLRLAHVAALVGATPAFAGATFTFDDPGPGAEFRYTLSEEGGTVEYIGMPVDFVVEDDDGLADGITFDTFTETAEFVFVGNVTNVEVLDLPFAAPFNQIVIGEVDATFEWRMPGEDGEVILSGEFDFGNLTLTPSGFNISANDDTNLVYNIGPALEAEGLAGLQFTAEADANWTLTGALFSPPITTDDGPIENFNPFTANSAFSGTVNVIPSPGFWALSGVGALATLSRRRRG